MTETTFALCKKPVVGVLAWLASVCVSNQALHDAYVDLTSTGTVLSQNINVPMNEKYSLVLTFRPAGQHASGVISEPFASYMCGAKVSEGQPKPSLSLHLEIAAADGKLVTRQQLVPQCSVGAIHSNTLALGQIEMKKGQYTLRLTNQYPVAPNNNGKVQAIFHGQGAGFP